MPSYSTTPLFSIQEVAQDQGYPSTSVYSDGRPPRARPAENPARQLANMVREFVNGDSHYGADLNHLVHVISHFDPRYDGYFDGSNSDFDPELCNTRRKQNTELLQVVRALLDKHAAVNRFPREPRQFLGPFGRWALDVIPVYRRYLTLYRLHNSAPQKEVALRRCPLLRVRQIYKFLQAVGPLVYRLGAHELVSDIELATRRFSQILQECRAKDDNERRRNSEGINFSCVKSITSLKPISAFFPASDIASTYNSELFYKNEAQSTAVNFSNTQLAFLKSGDLALLKIEENCRTLLFPPLRRGEFKYSREVERDVFLFQHAAIPDVELYITTHNAKNALVSLFPQPPAHRELGDPDGLGIRREIVSRAQPQPKSLAQPQPKSPAMGSFEAHLKKKQAIVRQPSAAVIEDPVEEPLPAPASSKRASLQMIDPRVNKSSPAVYSKPLPMPAAVKQQDLHLPPNASLPDLLTPHEEMARDILQNVMNNNSSAESSPCLTPDAMKVDEMEARLEKQLQEEMNAEMEAECENECESENQSVSDVDMESMEEIDLSSPAPHPAAAPLVTTPAVPSPVPIKEISLPPSPKHQDAVKEPKVLPMKPVMVKEVSSSSPAPAPAPAPAPVEASMTPAVSTSSSAAVAPALTTASTPGFDPKRFAETYQNALVKDLGSESSFDSSRFAKYENALISKKKSKHGMFSVFSSFKKFGRSNSHHKHDTDNSEEDSDATISTSSSKSTISPVEVNLLSQTATDRITASHNQFYLQDVRLCKWLNHSWSKPEEVKLKWIYTPDHEKYIAAYRKDDSVAMLAKFAGDTQVRNSGPLDIHLKTLDVSNKTIQALMRCTSSGAVNKLLTIFSSEQAGLVSNSSSERSGLSYVSHTSSQTSMSSQEFTQPPKLGAQEMTSRNNSSTSLSSVSSSSVNSAARRRDNSRLIYQAKVNLYECCGSQQYKNYNRALLRVGNYGSPDNLQFLIRNNLVTIDIDLPKTAFKALDNRRVEMHDDPSHILVFETDEDQKAFSELLN